MDSVDRLILRTPLYAAQDRYDIARAVTPGGRARPRPSDGVRTAVAAVADPWPDPERDPFAEPERVSVTVNRCCDLLEREASHGRISREAYLVGRVIAEVFERRAGPRGSGSPEGGNRVDHTVAHELAILLAIDDGRLVEGLMDRLHGAVGSVGARFLHQVLAQGADFAGIARRLGRGDGRAAVASVADRFRGLLEDIAADWLHRQTGETRREAPIVGTAAEPARPGEAYDAQGCQVPPTRAYAVGRDPDGAGRWMPASKRRALEREANGQIDRKGRGRGRQR